MANTRALKARIRSAENILQITKSMKMVSASKLRRTQTAMGRLAPMADGSRRLLQELLSVSGEQEYPLLEKRPEPRRVCYVLFVGNRGLCGVYNTALEKFFRERAARDGRDCFAVVCGKWGQDVIEASGIAVRRRFAELSDVPKPEDADLLAGYLKELYLAGEADEIVLVYQRYDSFLRQTPYMRPLLPVPLDEEKSTGGFRDYIFEPDKETLIQTLTDLYISSSVLDVLLEARTGEHAARMASMTSAADNTDQLISSLTLSLNHARQAAITTEISEIAGGAEALNNVKKQPITGGDGNEKGNS